MKEIQVGRIEMERDSPGGVVGDDPIRQVAGLANMRCAIGRSTNALVVGGRYGIVGCRWHRVNALYGAPKVARDDRLTVRIAEPGTYLEGVGVPAIGWLGH